MLTKGSVKQLVQLLILHRIAILQTCWTLIFITIAAGEVQAAQTWPEALTQMPLRTSAMELNRTNCVQIMLSAFQSNTVVKALVFMPGATDEFYLFRRARGFLTNSNPSLLDAVVALTNQSLIRATFHPPLLLLHTAEDSLEPDNLVADRRTADK